MSTPASHHEQVRGVQTAWRALQLLQEVVDADGDTLAALSSKLDLNRTTAYRLLRLLEQQGLVYLDPLTRQYIAGPSLIALGARVLGRLDIRAIARPAMLRVANATLETVTLHIRNNSQRTCIEGIEGQHAIRRAIPLGLSFPLAAGPSGKAILSFLKDDIINEILADQPAAERTHILEQVSAIRVKGYIASVGDLTTGVGAISAPIFDSRGVMGALTVAGPGDRWNQRQMDNAAPMLVDECTKLSQQLGASISVANTPGRSNGRHRRRSTLSISPAGVNASE